MPLLVDRPLLSWATIGGVPGLVTSTNLNTPNGAGLTMLVDCSGNDGAVVDSLSTIITEASTTTVMVLAFMSVATSTAAVTPNNTALGASAMLPGGNTAGQRINLSLLPMSVPVPNLASPAATVAAYPTETDKKNTGLFVPSGAVLYVGVNSAISAPSSTTRIHVVAQGGFY